MSREESRNGYGREKAVLRTMSYNIRSCIGMDDRYDSERVAETIRAAGADIVGLQEADVHWGSRSMAEDNVGRLAESLGMHCFFAPIYELPPLEEGRPARRFGVGLLSRFPIVHAENRMMSRLSTQDANPSKVPAPMPGLAEVVLDVHGSRLSVYVAHLDYRSDPTVRRLQVSELLGLLSEPLKSTIVFGDFNARPDAPELAPLFARLRDTWNDVHPDESGFTFPAAAPDRKIDYILASADMHAVSAGIVASIASDHRPITAVLQWEEQE